MNDSKPTSPALKADIRHHLAVSRTIMANERTLLAYSRTGFALVVSGLGFLHFTDTFYLQAFSLLFIPIGLLTIGFGFWRFYKKRRQINEQRNKLGPLLF